MKIGKLLAVAIVTGVLSAPVSADGTHGVAVTIINKSGGSIQIQTYNSKDSSMSVPHKVYYADNGGTRVVKAHGQGTDKIRILVVRTGKFQTMCKSSSKKIIKSNRGKWKDGSTITVASCDTIDSV